MDMELPLGCYHGDGTASVLLLFTVMEYLFPWRPFVPREIVGNESE